jgi:transposase-like protein
MPGAESMGSGVRYSAVFQADAVRRVTVSRRPLAEVAAELSVHPSTLRRWMRAHPDLGMNGSRPGGASSRPPERAPVGAELVTASPATSIVRAGTPAGPPHPVAAAAVSPADGPGWWTAYLAVAAVVALSVSTSALVTASGLLYRAGVAVHVLSLVLGFGAVLLVDWHGVLWLTGRRGFGEVRRLGAAAGPLVWAAYAGLLASGVLLGPNLHRALTWIKVGAVLLIGTNGLGVARLSRQLSPLPDMLSLRGMSAPLRRRLLMTVVMSQLGWWTAIVVGLITDAGRR